MNAPLYVTPTPMPGGLPPTNAELADLLRLLLDAQREQVNLLKMQLANQDNLARWRAFLARWAAEFPDTGRACRQVMPTLERTYQLLLRDVTDRVAELGTDLEDEFVLTEFLDKYGTRVTQLGNIIGNLSPIADAAPPDAPEVKG